AHLLPHSEQRAGAYSGRYEAGAVWAVLDGAGGLEFALDGGERMCVEVTHAGAFPLVEHEQHTAGVIEISPPSGMRCHATCFLPGLAPTTRARAHETNLDGARDDARRPQ